MPGTCRPEEVALKLLESRHLKKCLRGEEALLQPGIEQHLALLAQDVGFSCFASMGNLAEQCYTMAAMLAPSSPDMDAQLRVIFDTLTLIGERSTLRFRPVIQLPEVQELCSHLHEPSQESLVRTWPPAARRSLDQALRRPDIAAVFQSLSLHRDTTKASWEATQALLLQRQREDIARKGLAVCSRLSCGKRELTVAQFSKCGACRESRYCCKECQVSHWPVHKKACSGRAAKGETAAA